MKTETKYTPTPCKVKHTAECAHECNAQGRGLWTTKWENEWFVYYAHDTQPVEDENGNEIFGAYDQVIAKCDSEANAAFIVRAVNCHEELLEALKFVRNNSFGKLIRTEQSVINKAIAKAEKGE